MVDAIIGEIAGQPAPNRWGNVVGQSECRPRWSGILSARGCRHGWSSIHGTPEIFNTDQGSHFTAAKWVDILQTNGTPSRWTARGVPSTTSLSNDSGARSNTSTSSSNRRKMATNSGRVSENTSTGTTTPADIRHFTTRHQTSSMPEVHRHDKRPDQPGGPHLHLHSRYDLQQEPSLVQPFVRL